MGMWTLNNNTVQEYLFICFQSYKASTGLGTNISW